MFNIFYVDGSIETGKWEALRPDGVDYILVDTIDGHIKVASHSLYWSYSENDNVVIGWGSIRYDSNPLIEIVIYPDGSQSERQIKFMPDLSHSSVKLGWWWPGTSEPIDG